MGRADAVVCGGIHLIPHLRSGVRRWLEGHARRRAALQVGLRVGAKTLI